MQKFKATLQKPDAVGAWTFFAIPFDVEKVYKSKARVPVKGTINGHPYHCSVMPNGDGTFFMVVNKSIRDSIGVSAGDTVAVTMEMDDGARNVTVPGDMLAALDKSPGAKAIFEKFSYSHKKEYIEWIMGAKQAETRERRIKKAISLISEGKGLKRR